MGVSPWDVGTGVRRAADVERERRRSLLLHYYYYYYYSLDIASE